MSAFDLAMTIILDHEGSYSDNRDDPGNWTGGKVGIGELKGTMCGISAASYPDLDIKGLSLDDCKALYKRDYWDRLELDNADPGLALIAADSAINNGVGTATRWLQSALGVTADGVIGPQTRAAMAAATGDKATAALVALHAQRINYMANLPTWSTFGRGWSRRLAQLPMQAAQMREEV